MSELLPEDIFEKALRRGSFTDDERVDLSNKFYAAMERRPSPKVDMGPCGLSEEERQTATMLLEILDEREWIPDAERAHGYEGARRFNSTYAALVRRLLSSTPPEPKEGGKGK